MLVKEGAGQKMNSTAAIPTMSFSALEMCFRVYLKHRENHPAPASAHAARFEKSRAGKKVSEPPARARPSARGGGSRLGKRSCRRENHRARKCERAAQGRDGEVLRRRHFPKTQTARKAEGREKADEVDRSREHPAGGVHPSAEDELKCDTGWKARVTFIQPTDCKCGAVAPSGTTPCRMRRSFPPKKISQPSGMRSAEPQKTTSRAPRSGTGKGSHSDAGSLPWFLGGHTQWTAHNLIPADDSGTSLSNILTTPFDPFRRPLSRPSRASL